MNQRGSIWIILPIIIISAAVGVGIFYLGKMSVIKPEISVAQTLPTPIQQASPETNLSEAQQVSDKNTYTFKTFSFNYPKSWTVYDTTSNPDYFIKIGLNETKGKDPDEIQSIALEKNGYILFIVINKYAPNYGESGGIFISETDLQEYKNNRDQLAIQGKPFFLSKAHNPLSWWTDPNREAGIFLLASLSEFVPSKVTNKEQNKIYDGYKDYISNQNGYSYVFVKFSKDSPTNNITNLTIQEELKDILESIKW